MKSRKLPVNEDGTPTVRCNRLALSGCVKLGTLFYQIEWAFVRWWWCFARSVSVHRSHTFNWRKNFKSIDPLSQRFQESHAYPCLNHAAMTTSSIRFTSQHGIYETRVWCVCVWFCWMLSKMCCLGHSIASPRYVTQTLYRPAYPRWDRGCAVCVWYFRVLTQTPLYYPQNRFHIKRNFMTIIDLIARVWVMTIALWLFS